MPPSPPPTEVATMATAATAATSQTCGAVSRPWGACNLTVNRVQAGAFSQTNGSWKG